MLNPLNLSRGFGPESATNDLSVATTQNPLAGNLLQAPQQPENIERQYFYNKDLNKLFNMSGGARMAAPKGFESVNKNQYEDFASKGATLQGYSMFNDAMGGGYNLDLPRLTSGPNSGGLDRNSPEFLYYHGDDQKTKLGSGYLESLTRMPSQEEGLLGPGLVGGQGPLPDLGINDSKFIGIRPDIEGGESGPPSEIPLSMQQPKPGWEAPHQGIGSLTPTPQQPGLGGLLGSGNENSFTPQQPVMPTSPYQEQLTGFGEQLTGFGNQLTGFNDQFGGFNDQFGGLDKQFDMINTRLNSVDEGIASLSKQSQPQQQSYNSPYPNFNFRTNSYSNSSPFGLSSLFMGRY